MEPLVSWLRRREFSAIRRRRALRAERERLLLRVERCRIRSALMADR
jgi:hypothetical protein